jgi:hypothetical protein
MAVLSASLLAQGDAQDTAAWEELLGRLSARDQAQQALYIPFSAVSSDVDASPAQGWWATREGSIAFKISFVHSDGKAVTQHGIWDEYSFSSLTELPDYEEGGEWLLHKSMLVMKAHPTSFEHAMHYPPEFGLLSGRKTWSQKIEYLADLRILGREQIDGVDCLKVLYDNVGPDSTDDGSYIAPWVVWFDDKRSLLAMKRTYYVTRERLMRRGIEVPPEESQALVQTFAGEE